jgi:hypothetical protein
MKLIEIFTKSALDIVFVKKFILNVLIEIFTKGVLDIVFV